jgi:hypothetical protein
MTRLLSAIILSILLSGDVAANSRAQPDGDPAALLLDPLAVAGAVCRGRNPQAAMFRPLQLASASPAAAIAAAQPDPSLQDTLGTISMPITTVEPLAQRYFDQGLRWSFAFNHAAAVQSFRKAQRLDPACAMCFWGEAYALGPNINVPMAAAAVAPAYAAIEHARTLASQASPREQALVAALSLRYAADPEADRKPLDTAYAEAMAAVAATYPDNPEIAVLYAEALMDLSPWDYWQPDGFTPKSGTAEVIATLERVLSKDPDHAAAIHFYIHIVEASTTPERAEPYADRLGSLMPGAGHIVHMPSHIYVRVGRWLDSLAANRRAVSADEGYLARAQADGIYPYGYYPHNVHFLLTSAQMAGDGAGALAAADKLARIMSDEVARDFAWVQAIKPAPYFAHAQFSPPAVTLALPEPSGGFPYVRAMRHYARGIAAITDRNMNLARAEADAIRRIGQENAFADLVGGGVPAPDVLRIAEHVLEGRIAQASGDLPAAIERFRTAVEIQDTLPYMEPPYWYYPVRQSLGAALLGAGRNDEADHVDASKNLWRGAGWYDSVSL